MQDLFGNCQVARGGEINFIYCNWTTTFHGPRSMSASLAAPTVEDGEGMTALECAIVSEASMDVIALLQKAMVAVEALRGKEGLGRASGPKRRPAGDVAESVSARAVRPRKRGKFEVSSENTYVQSSQHGSRSFPISIAVHNNIYDISKKASKTSFRVGEE